MKIKFLFFLLLTITSARLYAQPAKSTSRWQQFALRYFAQVRIRDEWSFLMNIHTKTREDFIKGFSQYIVEVGLNYQWNDANKITVAQAFAADYPDNGKGVPQPEYKPWQQYQLSSNIGKNSLTQVFRLEERFRRRRMSDSALGEGYNFNYRFRYNMVYEMPLGKKRPSRFSFVVNNELFLNFGRQIVYNYFDQNNFGLVLKYQINHNDNIQFNYMYVFQQLSTGNNYKNADVIRVTYIHNTTFHKHVHH